MIATVREAIAIAGAIIGITDSPYWSAPRFSLTIEPQSANGGCTPSPRKLKLETKRITYIKSRKFIKLYKARNLAIKKAKGDIVVTFPSDGEYSTFDIIKAINQLYIKDTDKKISDLLNEAIATLGENIVIARFIRFAVGENSSSN